MCAPTMGNPANRLLSSYLLVQLLLLFASAPRPVSSFTGPAAPTVTAASTRPHRPTRRSRRPPPLPFSSTAVDDKDNREEEEGGATGGGGVGEAAADSVNEIKERLVRLCTSSSPSEERIRNLVRDLEEAGEASGIGQASAVSGLLSGSWELIYCSEDVTRSSPFFWAFRRAFPDSADQVFGITDAIPAPLKEVGPATQEIEFTGATQTGSLVSRVTVATLGGAATSVMTTRATIIGTDGVDGIRVRVDTTKPEESTVLQKLGPLGEMLSENAPAFPSGTVLEQVQPGSSQVVIRTTFCDDGLRVSRNDDRPDDLCIWRRTKFLESEVL